MGAAGCAGKAGVAVVRKSKWLVDLWVKRKKSVRWHEENVKFLSGRNKMLVSSLHLKPYNIYIFWNKKIPILN